jgi:hypothetical protein
MIAEGFLLECLPPAGISDIQSDKRLKEFIPRCE